jgi:Tfp pilus assembly protein PilO
MKKQSRFAIFLLILTAMAIGVLVTGIIGLQKLTTMSHEAKQKYLETAEECRRINKDLRQAHRWEEKLAEYDAILASLDKNLADYKYLPTYLEQLQKTAKRTGNTILSIHPRAITPLDSQSPLVKASYDRWLANNPEIAMAAQETAAAKSEQAGEQPNPEEAKPASRYKLQQFSLEVEGDYLSIMRLLDALRSFPKLVYVHSLSLSPTSRACRNCLR